ncbi:MULTISPECIES: hypothetical protein, partial [unclassified Moorena]|uniref:hypothetical protein n=1 Tax=unclassified Moorena TaxID=2683338 RepID=UPI00257DC9F8
MTYSHTDLYRFSVGFFPTPPNGIGFRLRCANGYSGSLLESMSGIIRSTSPSKPCVRLSSHTAPRFSQPLGLPFGLLQ